MGSIEKAIEFKAMTFQNTSTDMPDEFLFAQEEGLDRTVQGLEV